MKTAQAITIIGISTSIFLSVGLFIQSDFREKKIDLEAKANNLYSSIQPISSTVKEITTPAEQPKEEFIPTEIKTDDKPALKPDNKAIAEKPRESIPVIDEPDTINSAQVDQKTEKVDENDNPAQSEEQIDAATTIVPEPRTGCWTDDNGFHNCIN